MGKYKTVNEVCEGLGMIGDPVDGGSVDKALRRLQDKGLVKQTIE